MEITAEFLRKAGLDPSRLQDPDFMRVLRDGLDIQDRFAAEPVYARTGKGYLKSVGVREIQEAKAAAKANPAR